MKAMNKGWEPHETDGHGTKCPAKAKAIYLDGMATEATAAMMKGNYFETLVFGGTEDGSKPVMEMSKTGKKTVEQTRVEAHASKFMGRVRLERKMDFSEPRRKVEVRIHKTRPVFFRARIDMVSSFMDESGEVHQKAIIDTKLTDSVFSNYPKEFAWGTPGEMDHTQAIAYTWAYEKETGKRVPFWYYVMDVSPQENAMWIGGTPTEEMISVFKEDLSRTTKLVLEYLSRNIWPEIPSADNCRNCPIRHSCKSYPMGSNIKRIW